MAAPFLCKQAPSASKAIQVKPCVNTCNQAAEVMMQVTSATLCHNLSESGFWSDLLHGSNWGRKVFCYRLLPSCSGVKGVKVAQHGKYLCMKIEPVSHLVLQDQSSRRSADGAAQHRSTVDAAELQQGPALKPLKINKKNFAGLEAQGEGHSWRLWHHCPLRAHGWIKTSVQCKFPISTSVDAFPVICQYSAAAFASAASLQQSA